MVDDYRYRGEQGGFCANLRMRVHRLVGADLRMAQANGADFGAANLSSANLRSANLAGARFQRANASDADLREAELLMTDLRWVKFTKANITNANLIEANLTQADLRAADFSLVRVGGTVFGDVDLSETLGLDSLRHYGPSTIGIDTVFKSRGKIPEVFLRSVGVPERFITFMGSLVAEPIEFYSCFISYTHADASFARRLHDSLQGRGIRCWLDEHQIFPGDDIYDQVDLGLRLWDKVLLCCSKDSLRSWWVDSEIAKAFAKEQTLKKERGKKTLALIPLNLDGELFRWQDGKADEIRRRLAADFTDWERDNKKFEAQFEHLVRALKTNDAGRESPPKSLL